MIHKASWEFARRSKQDDFEDLEPVGNGNDLRRLKKKKKMKK